MKQKHLAKALLTFLCFAFITQTKAQWLLNVPSPNDEVAGAALGNTLQRAPDISSLNTIAYTYTITWQDNRNAGTGYDIYAQNYSSTGTAQWTANGTLICNAASSQFNPRIVTSTTGPDFFIAWEDNRSGNFDIYIQRVNQLGAVQWTANGVPVVTSCFNQKEIELIPDGNGGVIITWVDERNGDKDIFAQRIDASGTPLWKQNGVMVCSALDRQDKPKIVPDGSGGAIIVWEDRRVPWSPDVYGQRLDQNGNCLWANNGIQICTYASSKEKPQLVRSTLSATVTNFFVSWIDGRTALDPYYSLIDINGSPITSVNGMPASSNPGANARYLNMIPDRNNGAYISWDDQRNGNYDVYVQRITSAGTVDASWPAAAVQACNDAADQDNPKMATCDDELIIVFHDWRNACPSSACTDLFFQRINTSNGTLNATIAGSPLATNFYNQRNHRVTIMQNQVVAAWEDERRRPNDGSDIYCSPLTVTCTNYPTDNALIHQSTGVQEPDLMQAGNFTLFPNPTAKELRIAHPTAQKVNNLKIFSTEGKVVLELNHYQIGDVINISGLAAGNYFILLPDSKTTLKFQKN